MSTPGRPTISAGHGINIGLAIVLLGAAWQLGEKVADMRVAQAQSQGGIDALAVRVESLSRLQDQMRADLKDLRDEVKGLTDGTAASK